MFSFFAFSNFEPAFFPTIRYVVLDEIEFKYVPECCSIRFFISSLEEDSIFLLLQILSFLVLNLKF